MYLLTHAAFSLIIVVSDAYRDMAGALENSIATTFGSSTHTLHRHALVNEDR
jgi:hypothetical protein